jgi:dystrophin
VETAADSLQLTASSPLPNSSYDELSGVGTAREAEMLAEARLLRQHKGRLEARMKILEDHNKQLEAQLARLRMLLEQVGKHFCIKMTANTYM